MTLVDHLEELRRRLLICVIAVAAGCLAGFVYATPLLAWLKHPADAWLPTLAFFSPTESLGAYLRVAVTAGVVIALPIVLYQIWAFVESALSRTERLYGLLFVWMGSALFIAGAALAYSVLLPASLKLLLSIGGDALQPMISVSRYLSFALGLMLACGLLCELPLAVLLLAAIGIVTPQGLRRWRGVALVALVTLAALLTPTTDALSLVLMAVPLVLLYELSILLARVVRPSHALPGIGEADPDRIAIRPSAIGQGVGPPTR